MSRYPSGCRVIKMRGGHEVLVDAEDYDFLTGYTWGPSVRKGSVKVAAMACVGLMHRLILGLLSEDEIEVDHINRNPLDNRRCNLRLATRSQNKANRTIASNNTSGYKGIYYDIRTGHWHAHLRVDKKKIHLGTFLTKREAALAYNDAALEHFGEFAVLNKVPGDRS